MHLCAIVDEERLIHEQSLVLRLVEGLADEGIVVNMFMPEGMDLGEQTESIDEEIEGRFGIPMSVLPWMHRSRARDMANLAQSEKTPIDVIWTVGTGSWRAGLELAALTAAPVVLDVWNMDQVKRIPRGRAARHVAAYVTPSEPIAEAVRQRVDPELVVVLPMGVRIPEQPREILAADRAVALAIVGSGRDVSSYTSMLAALSGIVRELPGIQGALELRGPHSHSIWREARRLDVLACLSPVRDAAPLRALLTRCDVLIMPERFGEARSLTLEAMASGMAVVAADDPGLDILRDGETAAVVQNAVPEAWETQLRRVLMNADAARRLGASARQFVTERHAHRVHADSFHDLLERVVIGDVLPFNPMPAKTDPVVSG